MRWPWRLAPFLSLLFFSALTGSTIIDDQSGDPSNGNSITYAPPSAWMLGAIGNCSNCSSPSPNLAHLGTFHGSLFNPSAQKGRVQQPTATVSFTGSSVAVVCIIDQQSPSNLSFDIDSIEVGNFTRAPTGSTDFLSNYTVFESHNLALSSHILTIKNGHNGPSLMILDYVIYSDDAESSTTSAFSFSPSSSSAPGTASSAASNGASQSHTAAIVGGIIAGLGVLLLLGATFLYLRYRRNAQRADEPQPVSSSPISWLKGLWPSNCPRPPPPDMAPVPFTTSRAPPSTPSPPSRPRPQQGATQRSPSSRLSRISFNPELLVGRFRRPPPIAPIAEHPSVPPSPAMRSGNPLLNVAASTGPLDRVISIQEWQRRTQEATADEPVIHPLDMSEVDLSSHYDESSTGGPPALPPIPPPPQTPQPPQRRFTVMNN